MNHNHLTDHHRKSIRLNSYDYSRPGLFFITLVTWQRNCLFGKVTAAEMVLSPLGQIVSKEWEMTPEIRREIKLDLFVVMPNHFHGIIEITDSCPNHSVDKSLRKPRSLGSMIAGFKLTTTKQINIFRNLPGISVWQRNYYEHIIRNESKLARIQNYIINNPLQWELDAEFVNM